MLARFSSTFNLVPENCVTYSAILSDLCQYVYITHTMYCIPLQYVCITFQLEAVFHDKPQVLTLSEIEDQLTRSPTSQDPQHRLPTEVLPPPQPPATGQLPQPFASLLNREQPHPDVMRTPPSMSAGPPPHAPPPGFFRAPPPPMPRGVLRGEGGFTDK